MSPWFSNVLLFVVQLSLDVLAVHEVRKMLQTIAE